MTATTTATILTVDDARAAILSGGKLKIKRESWQVAPGHRNGKMRADSGWGSSITATIGDAVVAADIVSGVEEMVRSLHEEAAASHQILVSMYTRGTSRRGRRQWPAACGVPMSGRMMTPGEAAELSFRWRIAGFPSGLYVKIGATPDDGPEGGNPAGYISQIGDSPEVIRDLVRAHIARAAMVATRSRFYAD